MSATIHSFPTRRVQPHALDFSRATPAGDALVETVRANTRAVLRAQRDQDRAELVSALLLQLENNPLTPCHCYPVRADLNGDGAHVIASVGQATFKLRPADARTAADTLIAEQAFAGCAGVAANLREAAALADLRPAHGGPLGDASETSGRTGFVSTAILSGLILLMLAVSAWAGRAQAGTDRVASVSAARAA